MHHLGKMGMLALGTRLKCLSETLFRQSDAFYQSRGIYLQSRCFPLLQLLATGDSISVTRLAELMGQTHPAVSQMSKKLEQQGWLYHKTDKKDGRKRLLALTPRGHELVEQLKPTWRSMAAVLQNIFNISGEHLLENIELVEQEINKVSIKDRMVQLERQQTCKQVEIIHYQSTYANAFYQLNRDWLDKYFYVESHDHEVLTDPDTYILNTGGFILLARFQDKIIGTVALIVANEKQLELSKMAVDEYFQGLGIGKKLAQAAIEKFKATNYSTLYLESNRKLLPALNLYRKLGFVEKKCPFTQSQYNRADIYMEYVM